MTPGASSKQGRALAQAVRLGSFTAAATISLALMLFPFLLHHLPHARMHSALPIMLLGVAGAFIHGVGFTPDNRFLRVLFGPACAWILMLGGLLAMLAV